MAKNDPKVQMRVKKKTSTGDIVDGIRNLKIEDLNRTPLSDYYRMAGKFVNVENYVYYSTALYAKDVEITQDHVAECFTHGYGQSLKVANTDTVISKQGKFLTNMATDGEFDNSTAFLLEMISADIFLTSEPVTSWVNGAIINPAHAPISSYSAPNHYAAISRQFELVFIRNEKQEMVDGQLYEFPSPFVASGAFGASSGGFIQNGFAIPTWNKLSEIHALMGQERFRAEIRPLVNGFKSQVNIAVRTLFIGKRITAYHA